MTAPSPRPKQRRRNGKALSLALVVLLTPFASAAPPNHLTSEESAAGWRLLFDGTSTDSWRAWNGDAFPAKGWVVRDDSLHCLKTNGRPNGGGGDIVTRKEYSNFDLRWEWKAAPSTNSGVIYFLRRRERPDPTTGLLVFGHEYQLLDDDAKEFANVPAPRKAGALYGVIAATDKKLRPVGQFNSSRILVQGDRVEHWLNDKKVVEYELGSKSFASRMSKSKYAQLPGYGTKIRTPILIQDHGHAISFRNLKILDLGDK
jgi:hypothetical protein